MSRESGIDSSLLFFFLILVLIFCQPAIFGSNEDRMGCGC